VLIPFQVIAVITVLSTIIAILWKKAWWIRIFDFPRLQIIILQLFALIGIFILMEDYNWLNLIIVTLTAIGMAIQISYILPYLPFRKKDVPAYDGNSGKVFSAMVANVLMKNRKCSKLIGLVKKYQPDILLAVETDHYWDNQLESLNQYYKYRVKIPLENTYGMLLFSKLELIHKKIEFIYKDDVPSIHVEVSMNGFDFRLICLHPEPPVPDETSSSLPRDLELILVAKLIQKDPAPTW
jgi:endonuclease/exonuclease/phosphatase (EEP) superfamily protein YafD